MSKSCQLRNFQNSKQTVTELPSGLQTAADQFPMTSLLTSAHCVTPHSKALDPCSRPRPQKSDGVTLRPFVWDRLYLGRQLGRSRGKMTPAVARRTDVPEYVRPQRSSDHADHEPYRIAIQRIP
jgi:hypothetical protein